MLNKKDEKNIKDNVTQYFTHITYQMAIHIDGWKLYLNHYPFLCYGGAWNSDRKVAQAFGHVHSKPGSTGLDQDRLKYLFPSQYDVGVDNNNYFPISWQELKSKWEGLKTLTLEVITLYVSKYVKKIVEKLFIK